MSAQLKSWLTIAVVFGCLCVPVAVLHRRHGSYFVTVILVVISVVASTMVGEHTCRAFNHHNTPDGPKQRPDDDAS